MCKYKKNDLILNLLMYLYQGWMDFYEAQDKRKATTNTSIAGWN
jgi:hypothetical protein